jgi:hypothetical protein
MSEEWRDIKGYEGLYQVSNLGRIKSLPKYHKTKKRYLSKEKILKQIHNDRGYLMVCLSKNWKKRKFFVHRLVAEAFLENPNNYTQINHIKEMEKDNNNITNLEWCSCKYNCNYGTRNERIKEKIKKWN